MIVKNPSQYTVLHQCSPPVASQKKYHEMYNVQLGNCCSTITYFYHSERLLNHIKLVSAGSTQVPTSSRLLYR